MSLFALESAVQLGLIYVLLAVGIFLSFRILNVPDLTVDSSFTTGAAVSVICTAAGHPVFGIFLAFLAGAAAGFITAFLQTKLKVQPVLAGIITMTGLYSINFLILGSKPNVGLMTEETIFTAFGKLSASFLQGGMARMLLSLLIAAAVTAAVFLFLKTHLGLCLRATGDNEDMVKASSIDIDIMKIIGLCLSNGLVALCGGLLAQQQKYADLNMGVGMIVIGIASVIIGEILFFGHKNLLMNIIAVALGAVVYRLIIAFVYELGLDASFIKLISAVIIAAAISLPAIKEKISLHQLKQRGKKNA